MGKSGDIEAGFHTHGHSHGHGHGHGHGSVAVAGALYPGMMENPQLRWGFIRKVYSIVLFQILITVGVTAIVTFVEPVRHFLLSRTPASLAVFILLIIAPFIVMIPMMYFRNRHPVNMILLVLFTICISWSVGMSCATRSGKVVLEAAVITAAVVSGLTLYTFWAAKRGHDFSFLGPFLCAALIVMFVFSLIQFFIPMGGIGKTIFGAIGALVFSGFIIYDTDDLIKRHNYDEYVSAALSLYLDILNFFLSILAILGVIDN